MPSRPACFHPRPSDSIRSLLGKLDACTRRKDLGEALAVLEQLRLRYRQADEAKISSKAVPVKRYLQVLNICAEACDFESLARVCKEIRQVHGEDAFYASAADILIRAHSSAGNIAKALEILQEVKHRGLPLRRRTYGPLIAASCGDRNAGQAFALYREARQAGIRFTSQEYADLVRLCTATDLGSEMRLLLLDISNTQILASSDLCSALEENFVHRGGSVETNLVADLKGQLSKNNGSSGAYTLPTFKLENAVIDEYLEQILQTQVLNNQSSRRKEKNVQKALRKFLYRLQKDGGAEVWIDGANVGHFEMGGSFSYQQVNAVYDHFVKAGFRTRLVLHHSRVHGLPRESAEYKIVRSWINNSALYITPNGVNDDAFWMYGGLWSTRTQRQMFIVTNDLGRDHQYNFGHDPRFFCFMQAHVIRFRVKNVDSKKWKSMSESSPQMKLQKHSSSPPIVTKPRPTYASPQLEYRNRAVTPNRYFAQKQEAGKKPQHTFRAIQATTRVQAYAPGRNMKPYKVQPVPLRSQPVPYFKLRHFIAPNVFPLDYHFPFHYAIAPQSAAEGKVWFVPYHVKGKAANMGDEKNLFKSDRGDCPPIPSAVANRVRWLVLGSKSR